jgi:hypothetical protein
MSADVTAVGLSIGEPFVGRALTSLERQTESPAAVVRIDGVTPFYRAFNTGVVQIARRVTIGDGTVVAGNAVVERDAHIGVHAYVSMATVVGHDVSIGDFATLDRTRSAAVQPGSAPTRWSEPARTSCRTSSWVSTP